MLRVLLLLLPLALAVYALVDCVSTKDEEVKHLPKVGWILLIVLATVVGPLTWIFAGRERRFAGGGRMGGSGWVAPDDNPEFLASLSDRTRAQRERARSEERERDDEDELLGDLEEDLQRREEELRQQEGRDRRGDDDAGPSGSDDTPGSSR